MLDKRSVRLYNETDDDSKNYSRTGGLAWKFGICIRRTGEITGETVCRGAKIPDGRFHLQVHVCIFNGKGEMLIQLRQKDKQWYPDLWDYSVGGSAVAGDNSVTAAERETQEELRL